MSELIMETKNLTKEYFLPDGKTLIANRDISLPFYQGQTLGIVGESGCGKSTFAKMLLSLLPPTSGEILYRGEDITKFRGEKLRQHRQNIQMIFQDPSGSFSPRMKVQDIICEPLLNFKRIQKEEKEETAKTYLRMVDLPEEFSDRLPQNMSMGQRQRVAIARALTLEPEIVICDEATSALDVSVQESIINLLVRLQRERQITYGFISHDIALAAAVSHQIAVMCRGYIVEILPGKDLESEAGHPYTKALMDAVFDLTAEAETEAEHPIRGRQIEAPSPKRSFTGCPFAGRCEQCTDICRRQTPTLQQVSERHWVACHLCPENA